MKYYKIDNVPEYVTFYIGNKGYGKTFYELKREFKSNQKRIDNYKTSKELRKKLIERNKEILNKLGSENLL